MVSPCPSITYHKLPATRRKHNTFEDISWECVGTSIKCFFSRGSGRRLCGSRVAHRAAGGGWTSACESAFQRPPTSAARMKRRCPPPRCNSACVARLRLSAMRKPMPGIWSARGCGVLRRTRSALTCGMLGCRKKVPRQKDK